jgi:TPR repeat protein
MAREFYKFGEAAEARGDISGARRYYETAADQGVGAAALALGRLYDPAYVRRTTIGGIDANAATARRWYERAASLGENTALSHLQTLSAR